MFQRKKQPVRMYTAKQIVDFCIQQYGANHPVTLKTIAAQKAKAANQHKKQAANSNTQHMQSVTKLRNNVIFAANAFTKKSAQNNKQKFDPASMRSVNKSRKKVGLKRFTQQTYQLWFARFLFKSNAICKSAYQQKVISINAYFEALREHRSKQRAQKLAA